MNQYLSESFINNLEKFNLRARLIVEGFMIGLHKSPYHGFSVEFSDHRQYNPGDPIKNIDWKIYGKTNKYFIKRFEEETNLNSYILVDHSNSMNFSGNGISKLEYAKAFASALSYLMMLQQDAFGLITFSETITNYIPPKMLRSYLNVINSELFKLKTDGKTNSAQVLHDLAKRIKKRSLIILISDLWDDKEKLLSGLKHFRYRKNEVILFHILDEDELSFNYTNETEFIDSETGERITVNPWQIKDEYKKNLNEYISYLKEECFKANIEYNQINTSSSFETNLLNYLIKRQKLY